MNSLAHPIISTTPANIDDVVIDVLVRRLRDFFQHSGGGHHEAWLAVTALRNDLFLPGLLDGVKVVGCTEPFDGGNLFAFYELYWVGTGAYGFTVDVEGAGATGSFAAAELSPF